MSSLLQNLKKPKIKESYTAQDIQVLEGLAPVRHRPGMYIGGTDERAYHHLVAEILDNAMDEVVTGHASRIDVALDEQGFVTISDNGRGIPIDSHPKDTDLSALEVILTTLHSGGKFKPGAYQTSGGLHGVGLSVVNALSETLYVEVVRDKIVYGQMYRKGSPTTTLKSGVTSTLKKGTRIKFRPDQEIFGTQLKFSPTVLCHMVRSKAYLFQGVKINWTTAVSLVAEDKTSESATFHYPNGLVDYLKDITAQNIPIMPQPFYGSVQFLEHTGHVEWAINWMEHSDNRTQTYCNTIPTPLGGTHEQGLKIALTKGLKSFGELVGRKKAHLISGEDLFTGATTLLSVFVQDPQFQGQTKEKLTSTHVIKLVENAVKDYFDHWLTDHRKDATTLLSYAIERAEERQRLKQLKNTHRKSATQRLRLPGKLSDCTRRECEGTEILLVEGDSAGGSAKQARDRFTQAILPLRGKILNVASATADKIVSSQAIQDIAQALGCMHGNAINIEKLRYEKVIIMTDADVDGAHIAALLMTFFFSKDAPTHC